MKYLRIGTLILTIVFATTACKRDYVCRCLFQYKKEITQTDSLMERLIKKDAIYYCEKKEQDAHVELAKGDRKDTVLHCNLEKY